MSTNTKIVVLKSKEIFLTSILLVLGIVIILIFLHVLSPAPSKEPGNNNLSTDSEAASNDSLETMSTYSSGEYKTTFYIADIPLELTAIVKDNQLVKLDINNINNLVSSMYPLLQPSLDSINSQLASGITLDNVTYSEDNRYTSIIIITAAKEALNNSTK